MPTGRPSNSSRRGLDGPNVDLSEIGRSGTKFFAGFISEDPNTALQGKRGLETFRRMAFDPTCAALVRAVTDPIRATKWFVEPANDSDQAVEQADFVHHVLWAFGSQSYDDVVRQALRGMMEMGFNVSEIVYRWIDSGQFKGKLGWDKLAWRSQLTKFKWNVDEVDMPGGGNIRQLVSMTQQAPPSYESVDIPREKFLLWVHEQTGENFDGVSALRPAYQPWVYKSGLLKVEAIGLERAYMGIPEVTVPTDFSDKEMAAGKQIVENIRTHENAGIVHPEHLPVNVLFNKVEGQAMRAAVTYHDRQIVMTYLASFLELGQHDVGSYALSQDQSDLFLMAINGIANYHAQVMNQWPGIEHLVNLNYANVDPAAMPKLAHGDVGQRALDKLARGLALMTQAGLITPDDPTEDKLRDYMELPQREAALQPEAISALVQGVMPPDWVPGMKHTLPRIAVPPKNAPAGQPGATGATASGVPTTASPTPGLQQEVTGNAAATNMGERRFERKGGRLTASERARFSAADYMLTLMSEADSAALRVPEKPSVVVGKTRRPYALRMADRPQPPTPNVPKHRTSRFSYTPNPAHAAAVSDHFTRRREAVRQRGSNLGDGTTVSAPSDEASEAAAGIAT